MKRFERWLKSKSTKDSPAKNSKRSTTQSGRKAPKQNIKTQIAGEKAETPPNYHSFGHVTSSSVQLRCFFSYTAFKTQAERER